MQPAEATASLENKQGLFPGRLIDLFDQGGHICFLLARLRVDLFDQSGHIRFLLARLACLLSDPLALIPDTLAAIRLRQGWGNRPISCPLGERLALRSFGTPHQRSRHERQRVVLPRRFDRRALEQRVIR